ncbi:hypothetical protein K7432_007653 [Basidiobolus ranarum]|uniref:MYND-type domain-containing protein n=1 Tax=Basidiobolus ranarum TaxID=34480 RepID=A0ABR2WTB1_9FUNG
MDSSEIATVELGFAETPGKEFFEIPFANKIGGRPIWLNPKNILSADDVRCGVCEKPMLFLLQLYTPEDEPPCAYHRMVYIYCCKNGVCHKKSWKDSFKVFRNQLPRENEYYVEVAGEPADDDDEEEEPLSEWYKRPDVDARTCVVCGLAGSKSCGQCHKTYYCSKEHQMFHWTVGMHKKLCNATEIDEEDLEMDQEKFKQLMFLEYEIVSEPEKLEEKEEEEEVKQLHDVNNQPNPEARALVPVGDEIYENTEVDVDKAFLKFQKKMSQDPDQVIRYARTGYGARTEGPLYVSDIDKVEDADVPNCAKCGQKKTFEMQVLPQLLHFLKIDYTNSDSIDWGTLIIYSCPDNCDIEESYVQESIWRQDFSLDGINGKYQNNSQN